MLTWPAKDPNEILDYQLDWNDRLDDGETITGSTFLLASGVITIDSQPAPSAGVTTVWLSGGDDGTTVIFTNRVQTSAGRTYDQSVRLRVKTK